MYDNQKYNLNSGPFRMCSGVWDENKHTFKRLGSTEIYNCCLTSCEPHIEECYKLCNNVKKESLGSHNRCDKICKDLQQSCFSTCQLSTPGHWGGDDFMYEIIKKMGCGDTYYNTIDKKCIEINKNEIINQCNDHCTSDMSVGCEDHCKNMYDSFLENPNKHQIENHIKSSTNILFEQLKEEPHDYILYVLYAILISFILAALYIFVLKMIY